MEMLLFRLLIALVVIILAEKLIAKFKIKPETAEIINWVMAILTIAWLVFGDRVLPPIR